MIKIKIYFIFLFHNQQPNNVEYTSFTDQNGKGVIRYMQKKITVFFICDPDILLIKNNIRNEELSEDLVQDHRPRLLIIGMKRQRFLFFIISVKKHVIGLFFILYIYIYIYIFTEVENPAFKRLYFTRCHRTKHYLLKAHVKLSRKI